jgi:hypothetical protein
MKTLMRIISFTIVANYAYAFDDVALLSSIGPIETGNDYNAIGDAGKARGAYQMHRAAWIDGCTQLMREGKRAYSYDDWTKPEIQDAVALALIRSIRERFKSNGIDAPTPQQIALCWNMGFTAARKIKFDHTRAKSDYAQRVANLLNK